MIGDLHRLLGWRPSGPVGWAALAAAVLGLIGISLAIIGPLSAEPSRTAALPATTASPAKASAAPGPSAAPPTGTAGPSASSPVATKALEDQFVVLLNQARDQAHCDKLHADGHLRNAARAHSADMARQGTVSHDGSDGTSPTDRMRKAGYHNAKNEDIGSGYASATAALDAWSSDPKQRKPLLDCDLKAIGVGVALATDGTPYWTADFGA